MVGLVIFVVCLFVAGAMLVYDISRPDTRDTIAKWKKEIEEKVSLPNGSPLPTILLANKVRLGGHGWVTWLVGWLVG